MKRAYTLFLFLGYYVLGAEEDNGGKSTAAVGSAASDAFKEAVNVTNKRLMDELTKTHDKFQNPPEKAGEEEGEAES
jgi:hypothetical protein